MTETRDSHYGKNTFITRVYQFEYFVHDSIAFSFLCLSQLFKTDFYPFLKATEIKCCKMICHMLHLGWNYSQNVLRQSHTCLDSHPGLSYRQIKSNDCDDFFWIFIEIMECNMSFCSGSVLFRQLTQENTTIASLYCN